MCGRRRLPFVSIEQPSVVAGSARAAEIAARPELASALLPAVLLRPPAPVRLHLGRAPTRAGREQQRAAARSMARALARRGFCVGEAGLPAATTLQARLQLERLRADGQLGEARFVRHGRTLDVEPASPRPPNRSDLTTRLRVRDDGAELGALGAVDAALDGLAHDLLDAMAEDELRPAGGASLVSGPTGGALAYAGRADLQLSCFPSGGSCYLCHVDNADGDGRTPPELGRVLSLVYYLGVASEPACDSTCDEDGGALRILLPPEAAALEPAFVRAAASRGAPHAAAVDVPPRAGTLCVFRADRIAHEVRPCFRDRYAASLWVLARELPATPCVHSGQ